MDLVEDLGECFPGKESRLIAPGRGRFSMVSLEENDVSEDKDLSESAGLVGLVREDCLGATITLAIANGLHVLIAKIKVQSASSIVHQPQLL